MSERKLYPVKNLGKYRDPRGYYYEGLGWVPDEDSRNILPWMKERHTFDELLESPGGGLYLTDEHAIEFKLRFVTAQPTTVSPAEAIIEQTIQMIEDPNTDEITRMKLTQYLMVYLK